MSKDTRDEARKQRRYKAEFITPSGDELDCYSDDLEICKRWLRNWIAAFPSAETYWLEDTYEDTDLLHPKETHP